MSAQFETPDELRRRYAAIRARLWHPPAPKPKRVAVVVVLPPREASEPGAPRDILRVASWMHCYAAPIGPQRLEDMPEPQRARYILAMCAIKHGVSTDDILSPRRHAFVCAARHEAAWTIKKRTQWSLPRIGKFMADRDHTSILNSIRRHQAKIDRGEA